MALVEQMLQLTMTIALMWEELSG